ncbi:MAG: HupE/UreJ family protein [Pseudomonadota bacterium]
MQAFQAISTISGFIGQISFRKSIKFAAIITFTCWLVSFCAVTQAQAHEIRPAIVDMEISEDQVLLELKLAVEPLLSGVDLSQFANTDDAPQSSDNDALRELTPGELEAVFREQWPDFEEKIDLRDGEQKVRLSFDEMSVSEEPNLELPRDSTIKLSGQLNAENDAVTIGWADEFGALIVRQAGEGGYSGYLVSGQRSSPILKSGGSTESILAAFWRYVQIGFVHIIPAGLDHILFVLGLFFFSAKLRPLVLQITAFTVAHTVTLALATLKIVNLPAGIVEPLIAASIVYIGIENIFGRGLSKWRLLVVFCFGLLHGLGFAAVLGEVGLDPARFATSLIGFNIGVEIGQLSVILVAFLALDLPFGKYQWYRSRIAIPASAAISVVGAYWFFERVFG